MYSFLHILIGRQVPHWSNQYCLQCIRWWKGHICILAWIRFPIMSHIDCLHFLIFFLSFALIQRENMNMVDCFFSLSFCDSWLKKSFLIHIFLFLYIHNAWFIYIKIYKLAMPVGIVHWIDQNNIGS